MQVLPWDNGQLVFRRQGQLMLEPSSDPARLPGP